MSELGKQMKGEMMKEINACGSCQKKEKDHRDNANLYLCQKNIQQNKYILYL